MTTFHHIESQHWIQRCAHRLSFPHKPACTKHNQQACRFAGRFTTPLLATRQTRASFPTSLSPPTLSLNVHLTALGAIHQTQNPLLWSPPCRRCLSNSPDLLATSIPLLQLLCCDQTALCPYVGHDPNPTLDAPREGLRQGEVLLGGGGGGKRDTWLRNQMLCPRRTVRHSPGTRHRRQRIHPNKRLQYTSDNQYIPATLREVGPLKQH